MKLYSRAHVAIFAAALAAAALVAGGLLTAFVILPRDRAPEVSGDPAAGMPAIPVTPVQYSPPSPKPGGLLDDELNNIEIYERVNKAVVFITSTTVEYNWFLEAQPQQGTGSGVIIDQEGRVLTNRHVVKDAEELSITLADGTEVAARVVGEDPENDLAVVQFNPRGKPLTTIAFGSSSGLRVGQKVLAIGNPFGFDRTLTTGIVSGLARPLQTDEGYVIRETIQTDAAINPGNSGGPLLNSRGELIGINSAIYSPSGASAGVGFAVPINTAKRVLEELIRYGAVRRGWIDIDYVPIFPALVRVFRLPVQKGVLVSVSRTNALQAGIRGGDQSRAVRYGRTIIFGGGDIIVEVKKQKVASYSDFLGALEDSKPGEVVEVKVVRAGLERVLSVKLTARPTPQ
jgi:S1-C subfamily serine protease